MTRATDDRDIALHEVYALLVVLLLHLLLLQAVRRLPLPASEDQGEAIQVVFVTRKEVRPAPTSSVAPRTVARILPKAPGDPRIAPAVSTSIKQPAQAPLLVIEGDDRWADISPRPATGMFVRSPLHARPNPIADGRPDRFRMRTQTSPRDVVRIASQLLGFWPPGYSDDPCGGLQRSVEMLERSDHPKARAQLLEALEARARYCG